VAEQRIVAAERGVRRQVRERAAGPWAPDVAERVDDVVLVALRGARQVARRARDGGQEALGVGAREQLARAAAGRGERADRRGRVDAARQPEGELPLRRELAGADVDLSTREVAVEVGREGLRRRDALQEPRREEVERHDLALGLGLGSRAPLSEVVV
jgi:hypothetical protein